MSKLSPRARRFACLSSCLLGSLFLVTLAGLLLLQYRPALAATFADSVLRPWLGDASTVRLESMLFQFQDIANKEKYRYVQPDKNLYQGTVPAAYAAVPVQSEDRSLSSLSAIHLNSTAFSSLPGEGVWQMVTSNASPTKHLLARTFVRPDSSRSYAIVSLVAMDMQHLKLASVAGTVHPGAELGEPGPGVIPASIQAGGSLVAAFNGGFQEKDGHYGMVVGATTYVPLRKNLATLIIPASGPLTIEAYGGESLASAQAVRQNGLLMIKDGQLQLDYLNGNQLWAGATITGDFTTWRSGIGLRPDGTLIYAVGPSLSALALATALQSAGVTTAMELDVNTYWVRYVLYDKKQDGSYLYQPLVTGMTNGGKEYLTGYQKDFFYLYAN